MFTFAVLTLVAGGLLIRMARAAAQQPMSVRIGS